MEYWNAWNIAWKIKYKIEEVRNGQCFGEFEVMGICEIKLKLKNEMR